MDIFEILLTVILAGFGLNFSLLLIIWKRFDRFEEKTENNFKNVRNDMKFLEERTENNFKEIRKDMKLFEEKTENNFKEVRKDMKTFEERTENNFRDIRGNIFELEKKIIPLETILREREYCHFKDEARFKKVE